MFTTHANKNVTSCDHHRQFIIIIISCFYVVLNNVNYCQVHRMQTACGGFHTFLRRHLVCHFITDYCPLLSRRISHMLQRPSVVSVVWRNVTPVLTPVRVQPSGDGWSARLLMESYNGVISVISCSTRSVLVLVSKVISCRQVVIISL